MGLIDYLAIALDPDLVKESAAEGQDRALFETRSKLKDKLRAKMNGVGWKEQSKAPSLAKPK
jgi:hypothetical protein